MKKKITLSILLLVLVFGGIYGYNYISGLKIMYDSMKGIDMNLESIEQDTKEANNKSELNNDETNEVEQKAEPVQASSDSDKSSQEVVTKNNEVSQEQIENAKKEVTLTDKAKATKMVMTKLSSSDINRLRQLSAGGLTPEEKKEAVGIAYSNFSGEELALIKKIYHGSK